MPSKYEVFVNCPKTGKRIKTGYTPKSVTFSDDEKPHGPVNCPFCKDVHHWSYEEAQILEIYT